MPSATPLNVSVEVTPRFEIFYALQVLGGGAGKELAGWRRDAEEMLSARLRTAISSVAPSPLMWPLLADALRSSPPSLTFVEITSALRKMSAPEFQQAVLSGAFKSPRSVSRLVSKSQKLKQVVQAEAEARGKLLSLLGLNPFIESSASARAFERMISEPDAYRNEVAMVIESFWNECFAATWKLLERNMQRTATRFRNEIDAAGFDAFSRKHRLPAIGDPSSTIYIIPSAFNTSRLWAAYSGARGRMRYFIPLTDESLSVDARTQAREESEETHDDFPADPSLVFKALGDTTRYAMASALARKPMTSVELARMFNVSKPTISHHVQAFRAANLLNEEPGSDGVVLSVKRDVLERASRDAAQEMFSASRDIDIVKRTRKQDKRKQGKQ
jgi:DNA-binding transcriptional ArsR family regulator